MRIKTITTALITAAAVSAALFGCGKAQRPPEPIGAESPFASFRDIPDITAEEIAAIEALQKKYGSFVYGMPPTAEAFFDAKSGGEVMGFSALFCEWLTNLFQISFNPALYAWSDMIGGLERREIDFTGDLMATDERRASYLMTDAIAVRSLALFRISGAPPISIIAGSRPPRFAFLKNSAAFAAVNAAAEMSFDSVFVSGFPEAYEALASGEADAFISADISEASFIAYGNVVSEAFFPMVYSSVSLSTQSPELAQVVSVVQKALRHGGTRHYLAGLYQAGNNEYRRHKLFARLSEEERAYLRNTASVPMVARYFNYPIDFYNTYEKKWDGLVFDVLREVEELTGLAFVVVNGKNANLTELYEMVRVGEAHIVPEMIISNERKEHYIWTEHKFIADQYAL
ncbi:MAG: transporter substrate-binding domain-containing protein, partial [Chitinispirillales bacterium]|nr:transporter substrate-binding domain-containing protein [Chitinispirillales bacterium]